MVPRTKHGLDPFVCLSAMQKAVRRGLEREAMAFACELVHTSKAFCSMVANRLELIAHEDIDSLAQPWIVPYVAAAADQARSWWTKDKPAKSRLPVGNAIRLMCRAAKSREGDHFQGAVGIATELDGPPEIPDWAYDHHTSRGRKLGRGLDWFRSESTRLDPPANGDPYEEEFYDLVQRRDSR